LKDILFFLLTLTALTANGQTVLVDHHNQPISFVHVIVNKSYFITQTDLNGILQWNDLRHLKSNDTLLFRHVSYEPLYIAFPDLSNRDTITLKERTHLVNEVNISQAERKALIT